MGAILWLTKPDLKRPVMTAVVGILTAAKAEEISGETGVDALINPAAHLLAGVCCTS